MQILLNEVKTAKQITLPGTVTLVGFSSPRWQHKWPSHRLVEFLIFCATPDTAVNLAQRVAVLRDPYFIRMLTRTISKALRATRMSTGASVRSFSTELETSTRPEPQMCSDMMQVDRAPSRLPHFMCAYDLTIGDSTQ